MVKIIEKLVRAAAILVCHTASFSLPVSSTVCRLVKTADLFGIKSFKDRRESVMHASLVVILRNVLVAHHDPCGVSITMPYPWSMVTEIRKSVRVRATLKSRICD